MNYTQGKSIQCHPSCFLDFESPVLLKVDFESTILNKAIILGFHMKIAGKNSTKN